MFLSRSPFCDGVAPSQTTPFGYVMEGDPIGSDIVNRDILIGQGTSGWRYIYGATVRTKEEI